MPYIKEEDRERFLAATSTDAAATPGELNYVLTTLCIEYLDRFNEGYSKYNEVIGVLECCKLEMYRRAVAPYEDKKIIENGDVY